MSHETALEILRKYAGTKWDSECVSAFERLPLQSLEHAES